MTDPQDLLYMLDTVCYAWDEILEAAASEPRRNWVGALHLL